MLAYFFILNYGLETEAFGQVSFSKDPVTLAQLDHAVLQKPGIQNITDTKGNLDHISIKQNIFIQIKEKESNSDLTMVPIELEIRFDAKIRKGMMMKYGWTQEVKFEFKDVRLQVKDC